LIAAVLLLGIPVIASAQVNLIVNGSFEYSTVSSPGNTAIYSTGTASAFTVGDGASANTNFVPVGWRVTAGFSEDVIYTAFGAGAFPSASAGLVAGGTGGNDQMTQGTTHTNSYFLYLGDSANASMITQTGLSLTSGTTYQVSFLESALIFGGAPEARVALSITNGSETFAPTYFASPFGAGWLTQTYTFTPSFTGNYSLSLASFDTFNTAVDNVALTAIPEPSAYAAVFGACALGLAALRGRRARV
jgi:hypothetical protein